MRIAIVDDRCYWLENDRLWTAPAKDGFVLHDQASEVDAHSLSNQEVALLFEVLDVLGEEE